MVAYETSKRAARELAGLPDDVVRRFRAAMDRIEREPAFPTPGLDLSRLKGTSDGWKLRVGSYRGLGYYRGGVVVFTKFGHRSTVYGPG